MGRLLAQLTVFTALTSLATAGIQITKPKAGDKFKAGQSLQVEWKEGGSGPAIADLDTFEVFLCAGPNDPKDTNTINSVLANSQRFSAAGQSIQGVVVAGIGGNTPENAYYVKIVATPKKAGGQLVVYSDRISASGMTGSFSPAFNTAMKGVTGTNGPADEIPSDSDATGPADDAFDVEYTMQTGPTRYAPMQPVPGTKITAKTVSPQYPTSSVPIATSRLAIPSIQTTVTQKQTHTVSSIENPAAAAPMPSDDMARFLARWKD